MEDEQGIRMRVVERCCRVRDSVRRFWAFAVERRVRRAAPLGGLIAAVLFFTSGWLYFGVFQPPAFFPLETIVTIPEGASIRDAAEILKQNQVVRSSLAFQAMVVASTEGAHVIAGDYFFTERLVLSEVVTRITRGDFGLTPIRVTLPEGVTTYQIRDILVRKLQKFDPVAYDLLVKDKEGYLYPDTYLFMPNATAGEVVTELEQTFYEKLNSIEAAIATFGRPVHEIVTMASLLEKEASAEEDRRVIAGVLWKRIEIGMPLQVDAVFGYIAQGETFNPKFSDLEVDSLYNTYKYDDLPPGPIGNPSLSSIEAAVTPVETDALFYLHGNDGVLRTAKTYQEHLVNRRKYLD